MCVKKDKAASRLRNLKVKSENLTENTKYPNIKIGLVKLAREAGEEEDPNIQLLEEYGIWISKEEFVNLSFRQRGFFIKEPFQKQKYKELRKELEKSYLSYKPEELISLIWENGIKFMKYPYLIEDYVISDNIYEDLEEEHEINCINYTEKEWEEIKKLVSWKKCEAQVAREIIALAICEKLNIST